MGWLTFRDTKSSVKLDNITPAGMQLDIKVKFKLQACNKRLDDTGKNKQLIIKIKT